MCVAYSWLIRQLPEASDSTVVDCFVKNARQPTSATLGQIRSDPTVLTEPLDKRDLGRFRIVSRTELGMNRKAGRKPGFVQSINDAIESFYGGLLQNLVAYQPRAPRLTHRSQPDQADDSTGKTQDTAKPLDDPSHELIPEIQDLTPTGDSPAR